MSEFAKRTIFISGASRGIGRQIAIQAASLGANVVLAAKSSEPHPKLPGTIHSVAEEVEQAGGKALPLQLDVRDDDAVQAAMKTAAEHFGGIDALVNNAGAIKLQTVEKVDLSRFDLMHQINTRAVLSSAKAALPWLKESGKGHIVNLSPPINLEPQWFANYAPYTITKYGMSMLTIGMSKEFKRYGIAVNSMWPKTLIATAAVEFEAGNPQMLKGARTPHIMADAIVELLKVTDLSTTGQHLIDESWLQERGYADFSKYQHDPEYKGKLFPDLYL